ncbi:hypothetical protein SESBI_09290 [Sesbania bispinosa]|nr:hypothetical protein SESBI_09290 [Sesbania bispinosa]
MAGFARRKRVTDPFDDEAKARLVGGEIRQLSGVSSGSEHSGDGDGDSPCLSELVHDFLEDNGDECDSAGNDFDSERVDSISECMDSVEDLLLRLNAANSTVDSYKNLLRAHVLEAAEKFAFLRERKNVSVYRRNVMSFLREKGHNAAICKRGGTPPAGSPPVTTNLLMWCNLDRPRGRTGIFVGTAEELKRTVLTLCGVVKRCFKNRGLTMPPWRKNRYMQNKWFGPYRRTTNPVQGNPVSSVVTAFGGAKCRLVGFDDAVSEARRGGVFVRTR